jgi:hypothetical protein
VNGLIEEIRQLARRCPKPAGTWHPYTATILAAFEDLELALDALAAALDGEAALEAAIAGEVAARSPGQTLAEATARLSSIVIPEGRHPFRDEVVPTLEAMHAALAAVAATPAAAAEFERRRLAVAA